MKTETINEAFCDAWVRAGKPDSVYDMYARCAMGYRTDPHELFLSAFRAGELEAEDTSKAKTAAAYDEGVEAGLRRGRNDALLGVFAVMKGGDWPDLAKQVAAKFPAEWATAEAKHWTQDGDGS